MVLSLNTAAKQEEFSNLLALLVEQLQGEGKRIPHVLQTLHGTKFERYVADQLTELSQGTVFQNSIELISGQKFPDIIAKRYYGIEVKTSKNNHWHSLGGSVAEGTRIEGVERIYILFAKLAEQIDFCCRPYEECLSGVVVTHSPRYTIDMMLKSGETFFDKLGISYDRLRRLDDPLEPVISYFRRNLKEGETTWWLGQGSNSKTTNTIVRLWASLEKEEREKLKVQGFCLFPELLSTKGNKFNRMLLWLSTIEGVVSGNLRDQYTAGGRGICEYKGVSYSVPRILYNLFRSLDAIQEQLECIDEELLREYWGEDIQENRFSQWIELLSQETPRLTEFPVKTYLCEWIADKTITH